LNTRHIQGKEVGSERLQYSSTFTFNQQGYKKRANKIKFQT